MDERDVVDLLLIVIVRVRHHPVDPVGHPFAMVDGARSEPHSMAALDPLRVHAVRGSQHPAWGDQRAAALMGKVPRIPLAEAKRIVAERGYGNATVASASSQAQAE